MNKHRKKVVKPSLIGQYAGFVSRFFAVLIDLIIIVVLLIAIGWVTNLIIDFFNLNAVIDALYAAFPSLENFFQFMAIFSSVTFVFFAYTVFFWLFTGGSTIGKAIMGVRIVRIDGRRLTFWRAWARYIMFWVAIIPLGLGMLWVLVNDERRGWHDLTVGTCVIYDWEAREDVHLLRGIRKRIDQWHKTRYHLRKKTESLPLVNDSHTNADN